jgi:hypothetical protein
MDLLTMECPPPFSYLIFLNSNILLNVRSQSLSIYAPPLLTARAHVTLPPYETECIMQRKRGQHS